MESMFVHVVEQIATLGNSEMVYVTIAERSNMKKVITIRKIISKIPTEYLALMWFNHNHRYYYNVGNVIQKLLLKGYDVETFDYSTIYHAIRDELDERSGNVVK